MRNFEHENSEEKNNQELTDKTEEIEEKNE